MGRTASGNRGSVPYRGIGGGNSRSVFVGCYSESDQPPSYCDVPSQFIGGIHAAGINGNGMKMIDNTISAPHNLAYNGESQELNKLNITQRFSG